MGIKEIRDSLSAVVENPVDILNQIKSLIEKMDDFEEIDDSKESLSQSIINSVKFIFETYPTLSFLPVYSWGRFYENGDAFVTDFYDSSFSNLYNKLYNIPKDKEKHNLLCKIDADEGIDKYYIDTPTREQAVEFWDHDSGGGVCLVVVKENDLYSIICEYCETSE